MLPFYNFLWIWLQKCCDGSIYCLQIGSKLIQKSCHMIPSEGFKHKWILVMACSNRADSRFTPSHWEMVLLCNNASHWLGANLESARSKYCAVCIPFTMDFGCRLVTMCLTCRPAQVSRVPANMHFLLWLILMMPLTTLEALCYSEFI